jgi:hypothetical protein
VVQVSVAQALEVLVLVPVALAYPSVAPEWASVGQKWVSAGQKWVSASLSEQAYPASVQLA